MTNPPEVTVESANAESLDLIDAITRAVPGAWEEPTLDQFMTCTTSRGEAGIQIARTARGTAAADGQEVASTVLALFHARGFDAEIRDSTRVVGLGPDSRFADFNTADGIVITGVVSACYAFDLEHDTPTIPPPAGSAG